MLSKTFEYSTVELGYNDLTLSANNVLTVISYKHEKVGVN